MRHGEVFAGEAVNWDADLNRGLTSWWIVLPDQQRGNVFRDVTLRHHGALVNGPTWSGLRRKGGFGSLHSTGSSEYVDTGLVQTDMPTSGSLSFSGMPTNAAASGVREFWFGSYAGSGTEFCFQHYTDSNLYVGWYSGGVDYRVVVSAATAGWQAGVFSQWLLTWQSGVGSVLYRDGTSVGTTSGLSISQSGASVRLLNENSNTENAAAVGYFDDFRLWSRVLSASEAVSLCKESLAGYPNELNWYRRRTVIDLNAGGGGGFQSAWAYNSNIVIQPAMGC